MTTNPHAAPQRKTADPVGPFWEWLLVMAAAALIGMLGWMLIRPAAESYFQDDRRALPTYIEQLRAGHGMVFNPGERVLLVFAPLYILSAAALGPEIVFAVALALGAGALYRSTRRMRLGRPAALLTAGIYALAWPLWSGVGTALPLMSGLCLVALDLALADRWRLAGLAMAAAALSSPEALIPALLLLVLAGQRGAFSRFGALLAVPLILAGAALFAYYGPSLLDGLILLRKSGPVWLDALSLPFLGVLIGLAVWIWWRMRADATVALLGAWVLLYGAVMFGLLRETSGWLYAPLVGPAALLAGVMFNRYPILSMFVAFVVTMAILIMGALLITPGDAPELVDLPLPDGVQVIAAYSKAAALHIERTPDQVLVDLGGEFQPDVRRMLERDDWQSILFRYAPNVLILDEREVFDPALLARLDYTPDGSARVLRRRVQVGRFPAESTPLDLAYGPHLRLVEVALDDLTPAPGGALRVRLGWQVARPATQSVIIEVEIAGQSVSRDEFVSSVFRAGQWTTYHVLRVPRQTDPGGYEVQVSVIINGGRIARLPVGEINVSGGG